MSNLKFLAEEASRDYVKNGKPMNESITKFAEDRALNKHQIKRVVEHANQITYLSLFNAGNDKYASVDFDVADSEIVGKTINGKDEKVALHMDDYELPKRDLDNINFFKIPETEKTAEEDTETHVSFWKTRGELQKKAMFLKASSGKNRIDFERELEKFAHVAKREVMTGKLTFDELNSVFPEMFVEKIANMYYIPGHEKIALDEGTFCVNEKHPLVEHYNELSKLEDEFIDLHKEARELYTEVIKVAENAPSTLGGGKSLMSGIAADIAKAWKVIKEVPAKHLVGYPAAFLLGVMFEKFKKKEESTLSGNDVPLIFRAY